MLLEQLIQRKFQTSPSTNELSGPFSRTPSSDTVGLTVELKQGSRTAGRLKSEPSDVNFNHKFPVTRD